MVLPRPEHPRASERLRGCGDERHRQRSWTSARRSWWALEYDGVRRSGVRAVGISDGSTGHKHAGTKLEGGLQAVLWETCLQGDRQSMEYILEADGHVGRFKNMDINITFPGNL